MITITTFRDAALFAAIFALPTWGASSGSEAALDILTTRCVQCHGESQMGGLDLRTREAMLAGGGRGAAVKPGDAQASLLYRVVAGADPLEMPMGRDKLSADEVAVLGDWIAAGAPWEREPIEDSKDLWWSFVPPEKTSPPSNGNPVDAFVDARLEDEGLTALGEADRRTLIRRAYFDLHGLPPSPEAVEAFVANDSPTAWAELIDELLNSPRYGERWGRHWLDVVRYADTGGFETDVYFPNAWRYRDYVIASFNDDKPFDQFVREQIAGDELWPDDLETRGGYDISDEKQAHLEAQVGTGLYTVGPIYHEAALDGRQYRYEWLTDAVDTTSSAFLGLTLGCARCHDHKFDALSQKDYYRMMAVFAGSEPREIPAVGKMSELGYLSSYPKLLLVDEYKAAIGRIDKAARERLQEQVESRFSAQELAAHRVPASKRTAEEQEKAGRVEAALAAVGLDENATGVGPELPYTPNEKDERAQLLRGLAEAALKAPRPMATATVLGPAQVVYPVHMTSRGDFRPSGDVVDPGFPEALAGSVTVPSHGGRDGRLGRRAALADWLADPEHPLTARVMVNRVWQGHFGVGLVGTANDFGRQGDLPTHPELLDWLAVEFAENGWSVKRLHRLIMTSRAYRRSSAPDEANAAVDAENVYLWRMNRRRLEAEVLRDSVLAATGDLNLEMGGRPVIPTLTEDEMRGLWARDQWPVSMDPEQHKRRSVYLYVKRSFPLPMFTTFDAPDTSVSCARRDITTVAPQSLAMLNGDFMLEQAAGMARSVAGEGGDAEALVERAWLRALGRAPTDEERELALSLVDGGDPDDWRRVPLLVFNLNEFLYVD